MSAITHDLVQLRSVIQAIVDGPGEDLPWLLLRDLAQETGDELLDWTRGSHHGREIAKSYAILHAFQLTEANGSNVQQVFLYPGYAEPGYTNPPSGVIAFGNWNNDDEYDEVKKARVVVSEASNNLGDILVKVGAELEWEDEWTYCDTCGFLIRTEPDNYDWKPFYTEQMGGGYICHRCEPPTPADEKEDDDE